jgi:hypothetical protein
MEVHAPEHPIHTWRDFAIHIATIVVGLLIAIGLEQSVEWIHHRHIVHVARENIRQELENNHAAVTQDVGYLQANMERVKRNIVTIHALQDHPKDFHGRIESDMEFSSMDDSAWRSARDTGALAYMPYTDVQRLSDIYNQQDIVKQQGVETFRREFLSLTPLRMGYDISSLPREETTNLLRENAATLLYLITLQQLLTQLDEQYKEELKLHP